MPRPIKQLFSNLSERADRLQPRSKRSRSILLYLFFVLISASMWCMLTLNSTTSIELKLPLNIAGKPDNVKFTSNVPDSITVSVQGKGTEFLRYIFFDDLPTLELNFKNYSHSENVLRVDAVQLRKATAKLLGNRIAIMAITPDNLLLKYTTEAAKVVPVVVDIEGVKPQQGYIIYGVYTTRPQTVKIYGDKNTLAGITKVYTERIVKTDLTDTLRQTVRIIKINDVAIEPRSVQIMVPIEKLTSGHTIVPVEVCNTPEHVNLRVIPSEVKVSYLTPKSVSTQKNTGITVVVDYNDLNPAKSKIPIRFGVEPPAYQEMQIETDSVEYIIEQKVANQ